MELFNGIRETFKKAKSKERKQVKPLMFDDQSLNAIRQIYEVDNPNLHEIPFLGVVDENGNVEQVICEPNFPRQSRLKQVGGVVFNSSVDKNELAHLFQKADSQGILKRVKLVGHLHPTGQTKIGHQTYSVPATEYSLDPSENDISFMNELGRLNPDFSFDHTAITSETPNGQKMRIYNTKELSTVKKASQLDKISRQDVDLK